MVWRVHAGASVVAHTGQPVQQVQQCLMDEYGHVYLQCDGVLGIVHTQDVVHAADAVEAGVWQMEDVAAADLPQRFGFVRSPQQAQAQV